MELGVRQEDRDEWFLGSGKPLEDVLLSSPLTNMRACLDGEGRCLMLWGHTPDDDLHIRGKEVGHIWLVGTVEGQRRAKAVHRLWRAELDTIRDRYDTVLATTSSLNTEHHVWLTHLGFDFVAPVPVGAGMVPFYMFGMRFG